MKSIIKSLVVITAVAAVAGTATWSYFSDTASVTENTFSTGTLDITVNGEPTIVGFNVPAAKPGDCAEKTFNINNYGQPWFQGPSTLTAEDLGMKVIGADEALCSALDIKVEGSRTSGASWNTLANTDLTGAGNIDLFQNYWSNLIPGSSQDMKVQVCLPNENAVQNLQGGTCTFDLEIQGTTEKPEAESEPEASAV